MLWHIISYTLLWEKTSQQRWGRKRSLREAMKSILMLPSFLDKGIHYPDLLRSSGSPAPPGTSRNLPWEEARGLYWPDLGSIWQMVYVSQVTGQPAHGTANGGHICPFQRRGLQGHKVLLLDPLRCGFNDVLCQGHHVHLEPGGHRALRLGWRPRSQPGPPPARYLGKREMKEGGLTWQSSALWYYLNILHDSLTYAEIPDLRSSKNQLGPNLKSLRISGLCLLSTIS